jgi:hypothetical protein
MTREQKLKLQISRDGLREPNRSRDYNYKRIIIASQLHPMLSYTDIGREMNRNHATVINMVRNYNYLVKYKDFREYRDEYLNEILGDTLEDRILMCEDYWQMKQLQEELKKDLQ